VLSAACVGKRIATGRSVRRLALLAFIVLLAPSRAIAEDGRERFAIAVNEPVGWMANVVGISAYVAVAPHHVIRANYASYPAMGTVPMAPFIIPFGGSVGDRGGYVDIGAGWQWYPRETWNGPTFEGGLVWREDTTQKWDSADQRDWREIHRDANVLAARGLAGWSWLFYRRVFIMAAVGGSVGYVVSGTETTHFDSYEMPLVQRAPRAAVLPEGYLRFGWTF
jgi:hypothetical protein